MLQSTEFHMNLRECLIFEQHQYISRSHSTPKLQNSDRKNFKIYDLG
ncbi:hypothetical protein [Nostoc sp.]